MHPFKFCAVAAIVAGASASSALAAATQVNIADPNATTRMAHVEPGNRLAVQEVPPASFYHQATPGINTICQQIAAPPSGKALVIRQVRVHSQPGVSVYFYASPVCLPGTMVGEATLPAGASDYIETFDPGISVRSGGGFAALITATGMSADAFVDGYTVPSAAVP
jgi:hypothetical protein